MKMTRTSALKAAERAAWSWRESLGRRRAADLPPAQRWHSAQRSGLLYLPCVHTHTNTRIHEESCVLRILIFLFFKLWFGRTELYAGKTAGESTRLHLRDNIISRLNWKPVCFLLRTPLVDGARTGSTSLRITEIVLCVIWIQPPCPTAGRRKFEAAVEVSRQMVGMFR